MLARLLVTSAFCAALLSLTTACSSGGGGEEAGRVVPGGFKPVSCSFDAKGGEAIFENVGRIDRVESEYFGKRYNRPDLEAVLKASPFSTALYGVKLGAEITAVSSSEIDEADQSASAGSRCYSFQFLPKPSEDLMNVWARASQGGAEMGGTLQGLYTDRGGPKILIQRGSDRWTLVHELMHFNFDRTREQEGSPSREAIAADLNEALEAFKKYMTAYDQLPTRDDLQKAASELDRIVKLIYQQNVDVFLEEVTIEALLIDQYAERRLSYVRPDSAKSALWYIAASKSNATKDFESPIKLLDIVEKLGNENSWPEIPEAIQKDRELIAGMSARVDEISRVARQRLKTVDPSVGNPKNEPENGPENETSGETESTPLAQFASRRAMSAHTAEFVNSAIYRANKRTLDRLVRQFGEIN